MGPIFWLRPNFQIFAWGKPKKITNNCEISAYFSRKILNNGYPFLPKWPLKMGRGFEAWAAHHCPNHRSKVYVQTKSEYPLNESWRINTGNMDDTMSHRIHQGSLKGESVGAVILRITYGGELLYLQIFAARPAKQFCLSEFPFPCGLKSCTHIGNHNMYWSRRMIAPITSLNMWLSIWLPP